MNSLTADPILTLADLPPRDFPGVPLAVLGYPIRHSVSPPMHNAALAELARTEPAFAAWRYHRFEVPPEQLAEALPRLHAAGFRGVNLTVPHKVLACDLVRTLDPAARPVGAVNTLVRQPEGWLGANTDGVGLAAALREELGVALRGTPVILLGAGGAARGAAVECLRQGCAGLWIANRTAAHREALLALLRPLAGATPLHGFAPAAPPPDLPAGAILINATSAGLKPDEPAPVDLQSLPAGLKVYDMIYNPPRTPLLAQAAALGLPHANGLGMLVHQGAAALSRWTERPAPVAIMRAAAAAALAPH